MPVGGRRDFSVLLRSVSIHDCSSRNLAMSDISTDRSYSIAFQVFQNASSMVLECEGNVCDRSATMCQEMKRSGKIWSDSS